MKDKDASKISTEKRFGGGYIEKYLYNKTIEECNSYIKYFTKDGICKSVKYYYDKEFKHLHSTEVRKYNPDGSYFAVTQYKEPMQGKTLSAEGSFDKEERLIDAKFYFDKNRKKLFWSSCFKYNPDGSYIQTGINEQPDENGNLSVTINYDKDDRYIGGKYYTDKNFSKLRLIQTKKYNPDTSYTQTWIYEQPNKSGDLSVIKNYDKDDRYIGGKYYTDKNFSKLRLTISKEYNSDGSYVSTGIYEQPDPNGNLSVITYNDKDEQGIYAISYKDKSFSVINRISLWKHTNEWSYCLRIYPNDDKTSCNADIEKYEKNSLNLIYKKPCNFKGNLERVNRLLPEFFNN